MGCSPSEDAMTSPADPGSFLPLTAATFQILLSLARGVAHGYGIRREVEERTAGMVSLGAGTLYAGLQRLERDGLIGETEAPADLGDEPSSRWRFYLLT